MTEFLNTIKLELPVHNEQKKAFVTACLNEHISFNFMYKRDEWNWYSVEVSSPTRAFFLGIAFHSQLAKDVINSTIVNPMRYAEK